MASFLDGIKAQATTSTTGIGASGIASTLAALATGHLTLEQAIPVLIGAALLILFPQNTALAPAAQQAATDIEKVIEAYRLGVSHGGAPPAATLSVKLPNLP